jgi:hypothetical protein
MKKIKALITATVIVTTLLAASVPAFAFTANETRSMDNFFIDAQLLKGDGGSYGLEKTASRLEGVIILIRMMGKETDAQAMNDLPCQFTDVPAWAKGYVNYAYAENISKGVSDTRFGVNDKMTVYQYNTLLLRVLGYNDANGDFEWDDSVDKAKELSILPKDFASIYTRSGVVYTKGALMETSFCYLQANRKDQEETLIDQLIEDGVISQKLAEEYGLSVEKWYSLSTGSGEGEYYGFDISDKTLTVSGKSEDSEKEWLLLRINNKENGANRVQKVERRDDDGQYDFPVSLTNLPEGEYYVDLYGNDERYHTYNGIINSELILKSTGGDVYFVPSPVYGANLRIYKGNELETQDEALLLVTRADKEALERIRTLADEITKDCFGDYEKALAIHDWVANNVYYDIAFLNDEINETNIWSKDVLDNRFAVCSGYSNLTKDLLSAAGIPSKVVYGYALGISDDEDDWSEVNLTRLKANHAWNEAYIDGRWIIMDTTWDSNNTYEDGKFVAGEVAHLYFDTTIQFLSATHRSMENPQ